MIAAVTTSTTVTTTSTLTDKVTAGATAGLALLTLIVVIIALYQARKTVGAVQEALKARIDQRAPHVTWIGMATGQVVTGWLQGVQPGQVFRMPQDANENISLIGYFDLRNEGSSTAVIDYPEDVLLFPQDIQVSDLNTFANYGRPKAHTQRPVRPEEKYRILVQRGRKLEEWIEIQDSDEKSRPPLRVTVIADDTFVDGIHDETDLLLHGVPIEPTGQKGEWRVPENFINPLEVDRTRRDYRSL